MKYCITVLIIFSNLCLVLFSQTFNYSGGSYDLSYPSGTMKAVTSCDDVGHASTKSITINVNGIGTLKDDGTKELLEIRISLQGKSSYITNGNMSCFLLAPDGTCMKVYSKSASDYTSNATTQNYVFKNSSENCLNTSNIYPSSYLFSKIISDGPSYFSIDGGGIIRDIFNNVDADGAWKLVFGSTNTGSRTRHDLISASLVFGQGNFDWINNTSESGLCANGVEAIQWYGDASCYNNKAGKPNSTYETADSKVYPSNSLSSCQWNSENNYTTYFKFTPTISPISITIQGNDKSDRMLQSIIVKPSTKGIDPCSSASNVSWTLVACPRDAIYTSAAGTNRAHSYNNIAVTPGEEYYLVVDGSGPQATTNFTLSGNIGPQSPLPVSFIGMYANCLSNNTIEFNWATASETNNAYFVLQHSRNGREWNKIAEIQGNGNSSELIKYQYVDRTYYIDTVNYFRIKQVDFDGKEKNLKTISLVNCNYEANKMEIIPNPNKGVFLLRTSNKPKSIEVFTALGHLIYLNESPATDQEIILEDVKEGIYFVKVISENNMTSIQKFIVE